MNGVLGNGEGGRHKPNGSDAGGGSCEGMN